MRKRFISLVVLVLAMAAGLLITASPASAAVTNPLQAACDAGGGGSSACAANGGTDPIAGPNGALITITNILALVAGAVSIIFIVIGGFKYVTSNGDSSSVASAKNTIIYAIVGLVVAALARSLINFVIGKL